MPVAKINMPPEQTVQAFHDLGGNKKKRSKEHSGRVSHKQSVVTYV